MRWWGWGDPARPPALPEHALEFLRAEVGIAPAPRAPVELEAVALPEPALPEPARAALEAVAHVRDDRVARVVHAAGKGYVDLVRQRAGDASQAPDAVVYPGSHDEVRGVLEACASAGVAVVPFGGGTSVVGGVEPLRGDFEAVISLDLSRLDRLIGVDRPSLTAVLEAGMRGPQAEKALNAEGLTLGHFPQSYEYASIGGYVATRSAGQASTGYGRVDELVLGLRCAAPVGDVDVRPLPASAAGPKLRELLVGSEGTLGVITQAAFKVRPAPREQRWEGWFFRDFAEGRRRCAGSSSTTRRPTSRACPTRTRPGCRWRWPGVRASRRAPARPTCACAATRAGAWRSSAGRATRTRSPRARPAPPPWRGAAGAWPSGARRARRGPAGATTAPTCATTCWRTGSWSRRWRPRRSGPGSWSCTRRCERRCARP